MIRKLMKTRREMVKDTKEPEKATWSHIGSMVYSIRQTRVFRIDYA